MIGTLASFRAYAAERGNQAPTVASDAAATAALVRASDHITYAYIARFAPAYLPLAGTVPLDYTVLAPDVEFAVYEAATLELATPGFFAATYTPGARKVLVGVGDIRWQVVGGGGGSAVPVSTRIEAMLRPYLTSGAVRVLLRA